jgi:tetratricopeptide (TPR) repeat protein
LSVLGFGVAVFAGLYRSVRYDERLPGAEITYQDHLQVLVDQESADEAVAQLRLAIRLDPSARGPCHYSLGRLLVSQGNVAEGIEQYRATLRVVPPVPEVHGDLLSRAHNSLGIELAKRGELDESVHHFRAAVTLKPDNAQAVENLELAIARKAQGMQQIPDGGDRGNSLAPPGPGNAEALRRLFGQAITYHKNKQLDEAIRCYQQILQVQPNSFEVHNNLAHARQEQGRLREAIQHFREALRIRPDSEQARQGLARAEAQRAASESPEPVRPDR